MNIECSTDIPFRGVFVTVAGILVKETETQGDPALIEQSEFVYAFRRVISDAFHSPQCAPDHRQAVRLALPLGTILL